MRLLIITPRFPYPPDKGDRLTIYNYLKYFSLNHEVSLITFADKKNIGDLNKISPHCRSLVTKYHNRSKAFLNCNRSLTKVRPLQVSYYSDNHKMAKAVTRSIEENNVDLVYCHTIRMAEYVRKINHIPKVLALQISLALNYRRLKKYSNSIVERVFYSIEHLLVQNYEYSICKDFDKVLLISDKDKLEIERQGRRTLDNVFLLPHGVDQNYFKRPANCKPEEDSLIMTGNMGYPPNRDAVIFFCEEIFPLIRKERPGVKLYIVGKNPSATVRSFGNGGEIIVTGKVEDLRPYLSRATVGVVPTRIAAGLQNKLLEGMSMGLPMVATSNANEGIRAKPNQDLLIADNPKEFAEKVLLLLESPEKRLALGINARRFIESSFSWEFFLGDLESLMQSLCEQRDKC